MNAQEGQRVSKVQFLATIEQHALAVANAGLEQT
ncbi:hypothetical protein HHL23_04485 [Chryseobacterium sp. RP-3-3]|uniref:Uncharacterized protein n=1 Tax=Chryseobacterium antibioticum TaxID=2728847 RepID=A0A7Y0AKP7_9FLAO|nr:hypothetical protein [Chryseobacterium antibioticum]